MGSSSNRKMYLALKSSGTCVRCGVEPASEGKVNCGTCIEKCAQSNALRRNKVKTDDICSHCLRNKPSPRMKMCASCRIMSAAAARKRAEKAKEAK